MKGKAPEILKELKNVFPEIYDLIKSCFNVEPNSKSLVIWKARKLGYNKRPKIGEILS